MESDDAEMVNRIKEMVLDVLEEMDMAGMVRAAAAERLGIDLSVQHRKKLVQSVIDLFLESLDCDEEEAAVVEGMKEEEKQDVVQEGQEMETEVEENEEGEKRVLEKREYQHDDTETMKRIEETVWVILKGADMSSTTEAMVHATAAGRLGMDLSVHHRKKFVQSVIDLFLNSLDYDEEKAKEEEEDQTKEGEEEEEEMKVEEKEKCDKRRKKDYQHDDAETMKRIEEIVLDILKVADIFSMTEAMVHVTAAQRLGMDLSVQHRKNFVQSVIDSFLDALDYDKEKAAVVQVEVRVEEKQDQVQEGRMRKRRKEYQQDDEETVLDILKGAGIYPMTEAMVHAAAAKRLGMDLSVQHRNNFVQSVIKLFLDSLDYDKEKVTVVQEEARVEEKQHLAQEGRMRKRRRWRKENQHDYAETMKRIEETVLDILKGAGIYPMTEAMVCGSRAAWDGSLCTTPQEICTKCYRIVHQFTGL